MSSGLGADLCRIVVVVDRIHVLGEPVTVRTGIVQSSLTHRVALGVVVHGQRTLGGTLTYVAITSSGVNCVLKNSKGR